MTEYTSKSYKRLRLKEFKLNILLEITKAINNNVTTAQLFKIFEYILRDQLNIGKLILFVNNAKEWECILKYGIKGGVKDFDVEEDLLHLKEITVIESSSKKHLHSFEVVIPVYHKSLPLAYLLLGDIDEDAIRVSPIIKHMPFIQTLANIIAVAIENKRLAKENLRQERLKKELELASEMQSLLFPEKFPTNNTLQIDALYKPHQQVGGDYYDYIKLDNENLVICMADVSGKGVSAALLMSNFQANLHAQVGIRSSLTDLIIELNKKVMASAKGEKFITLFIGHYNTKTRVLKYINAAHNPPLVCNKNLKFNKLSTGCTGLGMFDEIPEINEGEIRIEPNSLLLCYTDGVVELENDLEQEYGIERLEKFMSSHFNNTITELNEQLIEELESFKQAQSYIDDITLLGCKFF